MDVTAIIERFASIEDRVETLEIEYGWRAKAEVLEAEVARLRAQVATLRRPLVVIYDLCQFNRDVGNGALLPPSQERDILDALATTAQELTHDAL
jgi:hypothetical protein